MKPDLIVSVSVLGNHVIADCDGLEKGHLDLEGCQLTMPAQGRACLPGMQMPLVGADISRVQDDEVGDGTTSVVVLAGELLREAEKLVAQKLHPMTIISGKHLLAGAGSYLDVDPR